jgi:hypothetical protein
MLPVDAATRASERFFLSSVGVAPTAPLQFSRVARPPSDLAPCTEYFQFVVPFIWLAGCALMEVVARRASSGLSSSSDGLSQTEILIFQLQASLLQRPYTTTATKDQTAVRKSSFSSDAPVASAMGSPETVIASHFRMQFDVSMQALKDTLLQQRVAKERALDRTAAARRQVCVQCYILEITPLTFSFTRRQAVAHRGKEELRCWTT